MPPCIHQIKLRLPAGNSTSEHVYFPLQGLSPSVFFLIKGGDDVLIFRHAARDIILAAQSHYKMINIKVPAIISKAVRHSHTTVSIVSLKNVQVSKGCGKGRGENIFMIVSTGKREDGDAMMESLADLVNTALSIAGGAL